MREDVMKALEYMFEKLRENESEIIANDISERAITHKMGEYLQQFYSDYNVDCEYNRNSVEKREKPKYVDLAKDEYERLYPNGRWNRGENDTKDISTYPDIIVHKRMCNDNNLLIIEVKKSHSEVDYELDRMKLRYFTNKESSEVRGQAHNYGFDYGVFIEIGIHPVKIPSKIEVYVDGRKSQIESENLLQYFACIGKEKDDCDFNKNSENTIVSVGRM